MLFSFFRDNGKDGVFLATSEDGAEFKALNEDKPVFTPPKWPGQNLTRDPSIVYHEGIFHMVWTSHWTGRIFGYASSKNLSDWSEPVQVRPFPESLPNDDQPDNVWAPEIHHDPVKNDFFILFASTTPREKNDDDASNNNGKPGSQYDNRVFITRTKDFKSFSDAKLFFDRGFASIDAVMKPDPTQKNWVMIIKCSRDESLKAMPGRNLWITRSSGVDTDNPDFSPSPAPSPATIRRCSPTPARANPWRKVRACCSTTKPGGSSGTNPPATTCNSPPPPISKPGRTAKAPSFHPAPSTARCSSPPSPPSHGSNHDHANLKIVGVAGHFTDALAKR